MRTTKIAFLVMSLLIYARGVSCSRIYDSNDEDGTDDSAAGTGTGMPGTDAVEAEETPSHSGLQNNKVLTKEVMEMATIAVALSVLVNDRKAARKLQFCTNAIADFTLIDLGMIPNGLFSIGVDDLSSELVGPFNIRANPVDPACTTSASYYLEAFNSFGDATAVDLEEADANYSKKVNNLPPGTYTIKATPWTGSACSFGSAGDELAVTFVVMPAEVQTAIPSSSPSSAPAEIPLNAQSLALQFSERSWLENQLNSTSEARDYVEILDDGSQYRIKYNVTLAKQGVVTLTTVSDLIDSVSCSHIGRDGTVAIHFVEAIGEEVALNVLFPTGATLAVDAEIFGSCLLTSADVPDDASFQSGFLIITSASLDGDEVVTVDGISSDYHFMFQSSLIEIERLNATGLDRDDTGQSRDLLTVDTSFRFPADDITIPIGTSKGSLKNPFLEATLYTGLQILRDEWDRDKEFLDFSVVAFNDASFTAGTDILLGAGKIDIPVSKCSRMGDAIILPVPFPLLNVWNLLVPSVLKVGFFLEASFCIQIKAALQAQLGLHLEYEYKTGYYETEFFLTHIDGVFAYGSKESNTTPTSTFTLDPLDDFAKKQNLALGVEVAAGPQMALKGRFGILSAGFEFPYTLSAVAVFQAPRPIRPLQEEALSLFERVVGLDTCKTCHFFELTVGRLESQVLFTVTVNFGLSRQQTLSGVIISESLGKSVDEALLRLCLGSAKEDQCGDQCCGPTLGDGACSKTNALNTLVPVRGTCPQTAGSEKNLIENLFNLDEYPGIYPLGYIEADEDGQDEQDDPPRLIPPLRGNGTDTIATAVGWRLRDIICKVFGCGDFDSGEGVDVPSDSDDSLDESRRNNTRILPPRRLRHLPRSKSARTSGEPHLVTFDGLTYDCQAIGEFILLDSPGLRIQGRFVATTVDIGRSASQMGALVIAESDATPIVQFLAAANVSSESLVVGDCALDMYVNGVLTDAREGVAVSTGISVVAFESVVGLFYETTGSVIGVKMQTSEAFGCLIGTTVFLNTDYASSSPAFSGLLGSPNGNFSDDWTTPDGTILSVPTVPLLRLQEEAFNYCRSWCMRDESESLFRYFEDSFNDFQLCDAPYVAAPDLGSASPELNELCGINTECLIDGILGSLEDARNALQIQAEFEVAQAVFTELVFLPPILPVGVEVEVLVFLNSTAGADYFLLYPFDAAISQQGVPLATLQRNFSELSTFYSNITVSSNTPGQLFGFRAVPWIDGMEANDSQFVVTELSALRSYSSASGLFVDPVPGSDALGSDAPSASLPTTPPTAPPTAPPPTAPPPTAPPTSISIAPASDAPIGVPPGVWRLLDRIEGARDARFGWSVALSSDASIVVGGAYLSNAGGVNSGLVGVYRIEGVETTSIGQLVGEAGDQLGHSVSLSGDGRILAASTFAAGYVRVYRRESDDTWTTQATIQGTDGTEGPSVRAFLSKDGKTLAVGALLNDANGVNAGKVRIFRQSSVGNDWLRLGDDLDGDAAGALLGLAVGLSEDGNIVAVAAYGQYARVYRLVVDTWEQVGDDLFAKAPGVDTFGVSIALSANGMRVAVGSNIGQSYVRVYDYNGIAWVLVGQELVSPISTDRFGKSVSLSNDGKRLAVGSNGSGYSGFRVLGLIRVFEDLGGSWVQVGGNTMFGSKNGKNLGFSVAISSDGNSVAGGGPLDNSLISPGRGEVYVYRYE